MTGGTMHFGPEWMRKQPASSKPLASSPPPPSGGAGGQLNATHPPPGATSYSALVTSHVAPAQGKRDIAHPFKYSRDDMLLVYRDSSGSSELPIEVERWEGIVKDAAGEPTCLSDFTDLERKLYATSLNSELRRRQSTDYMVQGDRSKGASLSSGSGLMGRRRRGDSTGAEQPPLSLPRKTSWSGPPGGLASPSVVSPRARVGSGNGFDGVLNGTDTAWGSNKRRGPLGQSLSERVDEEDESQREPGQNESKDVVYARSRTDEGGAPLEHDSTASRLGVTQDLIKDLQETTASMTNLSVNTDANTSRNAGIASGTVGSSIDQIETAKMEWCYVDPSGIVQGPFLGETMQLWHDQRYFTDDLMMKRIAIDSEFMRLSEIKRRVQGDRIFLTPLNNIEPPPGLGHLVPGPGLNSLLQRTGIVDALRQPSPQTYSRSNTLDSFINTDSTATGSASPSSSFGGNLARGPISPDPIAVGSRLQRLASDSPSNGRTSAAGSYSSNGSPAMHHAARHVFNEPLLPSHSSSFDTQPTSSRQIPQMSGLQGWNVPPDITQHSQLGRMEPMMATATGHPSSIRDSSPYTAPPGPDPFLSSSTPTHRFYDEPADYLARGPDIPMARFQPPPNDPPLRFEGAPQQLSLPHLSTATNPGLGQMASSSLISPTSGNIPYQPQTTQAPPLSPWGVSQTQPPRPRPFDSDRPTSRNTFVVSLPQAPAWNRPQIDAQPLAAQSPWGLQTSSQQNSAQVTEQLQSLTTANVTQHNQQHNLNSVSFTPEVDTSAPLTVATVKTSRAAVTGSVTSPSAKESITRPRQLKASTSATTGAPEKAAPAGTATAAKSPAATSAPQKAPWAMDGDKKAKPTPAPMNLREIQEAEKKNQEARKAEEKGRERPARAAAAASSTEDVQFKASWGLSTSQASARSNGLAASKDASAITPSSTSAPWTNAAKPTAKTMKEIQEEEERRKQVAKERETAASAVKRAAQAMPVKPPLANAQMSGGAWTVVSSGGKHATAAPVAASRPPPVSQASALSSTRPPAAITMSRSITSAQVSNKPAAPTPKVEAEPAAPSLEFMKWMRDKLRGLNSSVQFEEIAQVLLSFPLDPDEATKEIIAETIYGASTTLDGRHIMEEFVKKRKEDALNRPKGVQQVVNGKPPSLADVVKTQPKVTQNESVPFKVVKKKNKRS